MRICTALCFVLLGISSISASTTQDLFHPEELAGRWEASDGQGGQIGMNILISTTVPGSATDLIGVPQTLESFQIGLYQRSGSDVKPLGFQLFDHFCGRGSDLGRSAPPDRSSAEGGASRGACRPCMEQHNSGLDREF